MSLPSHLPTVTQETLSWIVVEIGHGEIDKMNVCDVAIESDLDGLVKLVQGFVPADTVLEVLPLVITHQASDGLFKELIQDKRTDHSAGTWDQLSQFQGLNILDLISDEVNSTSSSIAHDKRVSHLDGVVVSGQRVKGGCLGLFD